MKKIVIKIEGMHCEGCKRRVLNAVKGFKLKDVNVDLESKTLEASFKNEINKEEIARAIENCGFEIKNIDIGE